LLAGLFLAIKLDHRIEITHFCLFNVLGFPSVRIQHRGGYTFVFNYGNEAVVLPAASLEKANFIIGTEKVDAFGVSVYSLAN
jgi:hypothetical protein